MVLVGRVARPHGLRGQVVINPETDFVEQRFRVGSEMWAGSAAAQRRLVVSSARLGSRRPVIAFEGMSTVEEAEQLRGMELRVPEAALAPLGRDEYYEHQLVGCSVETVAGVVVGAVSGVVGATGSPVLLVEGRDGEVLIPMAREICVEIDVKSRRIRVAPPDGLLELNERKADSQRS